VLSHKLGSTRRIELFRSYTAKRAPAEVMGRWTDGEAQGAWDLTAASSRRARPGCALVANPELSSSTSHRPDSDPQSRRQVWEIVNRLKGAKPPVLCAPPPTT